MSRFHLIDLSFSDVGPLFRLLQLVLHLSQFGQTSVGLFFLSGSRTEDQRKPPGGAVNQRSVSNSLFSLPLVGLDLQLQFVH